MLSFSRTWLIQVLFFPWAVIPTSFRPSCTASSDTVNFVQSPNIRGTLDVIWSCVFTIFVCSWAIQHLNIPEQVPESTTWRQSLARSVKRFGSTTIWMLITMLLPEVLLGIALQDFMRARRSVREMEDWARADRVLWTLAHARYANMGGLMFRVQGEPFVAESLDSPHPSTISLVTLQRVYDTIKNRSGSALQERKDFQIQNNFDRKNAETELSIEEVDLGYRIHSHCGDYSNTSSHISGLSRSGSIQSSQNRTHGPASTCTSFPTDSNEEIDVMSNFQTGNDAVSGLGDEEKRAGSISTQCSMLPYQIYPNADQVRLLRECGVIKRLPDISEETIADLSKGDALIKAIALAQVSYLVVSLITRVAKHLAITQLEIATLAFSICAFMIFVLFWSKPQGITIPSDVIGDQPIDGGNFTPICLQIARWSAVDDFRGFFGFSQHWDDSFLFPPELDLVWDEGLTFGVRDGKQYLRYVQFGIAAAGTVMGGVYCIAWSFEFPSFVESVIWRVASLVLTSSLPFFLLSPFYFPLSKGMRRMNIIPFIINFIYLIARLCLIALVVRSMLYLPPEAFVATWATQIPHVP